MEIYFFKKNCEERELLIRPDFDLFDVKTEMQIVSASSWESAREKLLSTKDNIAYLHVLESTEISY